MCVLSQSLFQRDLQLGGRYLMLGWLPMVETPSCSSLKYIGFGGTADYSSTQVFKYLALKKMLRLLGSFNGEWLQSRQIFILSPKDFKPLFTCPNLFNCHLGCLYWPKIRLPVVLKKFQGLFRGIFDLKSNQVSILQHKLP